MNNYMSRRPPPWTFYLAVGERKKLQEAEELPSSAGVVEIWFEDRYGEIDLPPKPRQLYFTRDGHQVELDDYSAKRLRDGEVMTLATSAIATPSPTSPSSSALKRVSNISHLTNMINKSHGRLLDDSLLGLVGGDFRVHTITQYLKVVEPKPSVTHLLLNANNLTDASLSSMVELIPLKFPNLEFLDLASNRFTEKASSDIVKLMQGLPKLRWIDLTCNSNGLVDISNSEWFGDQLAKVESLLQKVIFLTRPLLAEDTWHPMISGDQGLISVVRETHKQYYTHRKLTIRY